MNDRLKALADAGVSIWLDDLSRERLETGNLADLVKHSHVVGVTSNPAIFQAALADGERYDAQVRELAAAGADVDKATQAITTDDVREACKVMRPVFDATDGVDGRVSIEVSPGLAHDTDGDRRRRPPSSGRSSASPTCSSRSPAPQEGWPAITETIAAGISVNVTLIFGLEQYRNVMEAYVSGLEQAPANGHELADIHSVASFFVSRVDSEIDKRLEATTEGPGTDPDAARQGRRRQRPPRLPDVRGVLQRPALGGARGRGRPQAAAAVGLDRRQEPRLRRHDVRRRPGRRGHRQHDAGEDPRGGRRPRRGAGRPGPAVLRRRRRPHAGAGRRRASTTTT